MNLFTLLFCVTRQSLIHLNFLGGVVCSLRSSESDFKYVKKMINRLKLFLFVLQAVAELNIFLHVYLI